MGQHCCASILQRRQATRVLVGLIIGVISVTGLSQTALAGQGRPAAIPVEADPRVELIGIVFRLAGHWEYKQCRIPSYASDIDEHFGDFAQHPVVKLAAKLRDTSGVSYDAPMSLAIHIDCDLRPLKSFEQWPWGLDGRWHKEETQEFLAALRDFAAETKFDAFFQAHRPMCDKGIASCQAVLAQFDLTGWFDDFFGIEKTDELRVVLGFNNGCSNYGLRVMIEKGLRKYAIVGMEFCDPQGDPTFDPRLLVLAAHEFCHSFTNPVVNEYMEQLQPAAERFYATHAQAMRNIGYGDWRSVMYETAVRACVASFVRTAIEPQHPGLCRLYIQREAGFGFTWIEEMDALLKTYEANREQYPTFASFFPNIVAFLDDHTKETKS